MFWDNKYQKNGIKNISFKLSAGVEDAPCKEHIFDKTESNIPDFYAFKEKSVKFYKEHIDAAKEEKIEVDIYLSSHLPVVETTVGITTLIDTVKSYNQERVEKKEIFFNIYYLIEGKSYKSVMAL